MVIAPTETMPHWKRVLGSAVIPFALASAALGACGGDPSSEAPAVSDDAVAAAPRPGRALPLDAAGCIDMTAHHHEPISLTGRLVVTFYEPTLNASTCEKDDETSTYWCKSRTSTSSECAEVAGEFWCPNANPTPAQLGDPQELGHFDLANPGAGVHRWTNNAVHEAELDISPDGKRVVYAVRKRIDAFEDGMGIWVSDSDGKNPRKVVDLSGHTGIPTWLPPGNDRFTFIADGLKVFDMASSTTIDVKIANFDSGFVVDPEASHDGRKLTFKADVSGGNAPAIYVMDFDGKAGSNVKQLTRGFSDHDPVFSRDNKKIYFERYYGPGEWNQGGNKLENPAINQWGIVEVDPTSGQERVLIPHDKCGKHFWWLPTLSPDNKHLMFIHDAVGVGEDGYQDLWISDLNGENAQPVPGTKGIHWFDWE
jgi:hypothetical protein